MQVNTIRPAHVRRYTQYIPLSIYELQSWLGTPSIYVLDCSAAGLIINAFRAFMDQRPQPGQVGGGEGGGKDKEGERRRKRVREEEGWRSRPPVKWGLMLLCIPPPQAALPPPASTALPPGGTDPLREVILLAACAATEVLPQNPDLPADVFTACLTTPIKVGVEGESVGGQGVDGQGVEGTELFIL